VGQWLARVKALLTPEQWASMFEGSPNAVPEPIPCTMKEAEALIALSQDPLTLGRPWNTRHLRILREMRRLAQWAAGGKLPDPQKPTPRARKKPKSGR
jgi:hypothetical protein